MAYMSSIERIGMEIGRKEGLKQGLKEGLKEGLQEGLQEGRREALAETLALLLSQRFGEPDAVVCGRLKAATADQLAAWTKNVLAAPSLPEVFADK
jgi:flagellar biosynthesis/type III secretory pathway protein FliH